MTVSIAWSTQTIVTCSMGHMHHLKDGGFSLRNKQSPMDLMMPSARTVQRLICLQH